MNNALLYLGGLLITILAVVFAVPRFVDWNSYRGIFEEEATRILGRQVRVGGAVNVRLLPAPYVSFERLRIADVGDQGGNSIIRVESFTMWLSVPPLLRGEVEAHRVELERPVLTLTLNKTGSGNWQSLAITPGALPFAPKSIALQSVLINDGAIIVNGASQAELARFDEINGELNAESLDGPYKFKGDVSWNGAPRHVRLATAKRDDNGDIRFKAAVNVAASGNSYAFDGRVGDLMTAPHIDGELNAKLMLGGKPAAETVADLPELAPAPAAPVSPSGEPPAAPEPPAVPEPAAAPSPVAPPVAPGNARGFELKAQVKGTTLGLELANIAISLEAGTTPQLISGDAKVVWAERMRLDVTLASRWLDLDQLAHTSDSGIPLEAGRSYFEALAAALPAEADTSAVLEFDQLTLGGEPISNVRLAATRSGGPLQLKGVRADLPGGVRLDLEGVLTPTKSTPRLDGTLFVSGRSLMRFLAWGLAKPNIGEGRNDGEFSIDGRFALGDGTMALTESSVTFANTPLAGDLRLEMGTRKKLTVALQGPRLDLAQIGSGLLGLKTLRALLFGADGPDQAAAEEASAVSNMLNAANADLLLDLKVASLVEGDRALKDVDTELRLEGGRLSISRLRFSTPEGLYIDAEGEATNVPEQPKGAIRTLVSAPNPAAARALVSLLDTTGSAGQMLDRIARLAPFRLAGTLGLEGAPGNATTLSANGTVAGGRLSASLKLGGGRAKWRSSPLDMTLFADNPDVARLVGALFDAETGASGDGPAAGQVVVKAAGVPADGLVSLADVTADGLSLRYRGTIGLPKPDETAIDGSLTVVSRDARAALALVDLVPPDGAAGTVIDGTVKVKTSGAMLTLSSTALTLGDSIVSGDVSLTAKDDGRRTVDAKLKASRGSFASLLSPLMAKAVPAPPEEDTTDASRRKPVDAKPAQGQAEAEPPAAVWPDQPFDLGLLDRVDGTVQISFGSLAVEPGLSIGNAMLSAELAPSGIKVTQLDGDVLGGRLRSQLEIEKAAAGVAASGSVKIDIWSKRPAASETDPPPGDAVAFNVTYSGRALSPLALVASLSGKGGLTVGDATLQGNSPAAVSAVAQAALTGQGPSSGNALSEAIAAALKQGSVNLGKLSVPVEIRDGALQLEKVRIDMAEGRSTFATAVELATMRMDSEWQIEPKLGKGLTAQASRQLLPAVTVVYTGKLSDFTALMPHVAAGALERELVVRKMELDVGELERLRKQDEERARKEAERRKAEEAERARIEAERLKALEEDQQTPPAGVDGLSDPNATGQQTNPASPAVNGAQWTACTGSGDAETAMAACERLLAAGTLTDGDQATVRLKYARALRNLGAVDRAIANYNQSIQLAPSAEAFNHRGIAHFDKGDYDKAIADYNEALRLDPQLAEALNNRAWTRYKAGNLNAALDDANRAIELDATQAYVWDTRGHINETRGARSAAISDYRRALDLDANSTSSSEGLRRLGVDPTDSLAPSPVPSQAAQRPRRKKPAEDNWRPFQTPY